MNFLFFLLFIFHTKPYPFEYCVIKETPMKQLIISLKSRNEVYGFARILKSNGIYLSIINTPKIIGSSCMLCIKTEFRNLSIITQMIKQLKPKSFLGVYSVTPTQNGEQILKLM